MAAAELYGAAVGACFLDSLATPWLWPPSEPWCLRRALAHGLATFPVEGDASFSDGLGESQPKQQFL